MNDRMVARREFLREDSVSRLRSLSLSLVTISELLFAGHGRFARHIGPRVALPGDFGADPAANRLIGRLGGLDLLLAVELLEQFIGKVGADRKRQRNDIARDAGAAEQIASDRVQHAAEQRSFRLLFSRVGALLGSVLGSRRRGNRNRYRRSSQQPGQNQGTHHESPPCRLGRKLSFDFKGVNEAWLSGKGVFRRCAARACCGATSRRREALRVARFGGRSTQSARRPFPPGPRA